MTGSCSYLCSFEFIISRRYFPNLLITRHFIISDTVFLTCSYRQQIHFSKIICYARANVLFMHVEIVFLNSLTFFRHMSRLLESYDMGGFQCLKFFPVEKQQKYSTKITLKFYSCWLDVNFIKNTMNIQQCKHNIYV